MKLALVLLLSAGTALAQEPESRARVNAGVGVARTPKYPGSDKYEVRAIPLISVNFGRFFLGGEPGGAGSPGAGVNLLRDEHWRAGIGVSLAGAFRKPREESDHPSLQGMGDIDRTVRGVAYLGYAQGRLTTFARVATDLRGKDQGTLVLLDSVLRYPATDRLTLSAGPGITWADREYAMTFFGVSAAQAARSVLPAYQADAGLHAIRLGAGASYRIDRNWNAVLRTNAIRLVGDAADSPVTRARSQYTAGVFVAYEF